MPLFYVFLSRYQVLSHICLLAEIRGEQYRIFVRFSSLRQQYQIKPFVNQSSDTIELEIKRIFVIDNLK